MGTEALAADRWGAVPVAGQAQGQYPMCQGEDGQHPPPAGRALLVAVQQQQWRAGPGLQILQRHPGHADPTVLNGDANLVGTAQLGR